MKRYIGTTVRGLRGPIFKQGDDLLTILPELLSESFAAEGFKPGRKDVLCITESVLARCQGNYASIDDIAEDVRALFPDQPRVLGLTLPILSRNRFSVLLRGIARACDRLIIQLSYPADEVGNQLMDYRELLNSEINPYRDVFTEAEFYQQFSRFKHLFTDIDYVQLYREIAESENCQCNFIFANDPRAVLASADQVICCDIHSRENSKRILQEAGARRVIGLDEILAQPSSTHGYNEDYGILGSNKATESRIKLFPRDAQKFVDDLAERLAQRFGQSIEVMVYGDGAFKDPYGKIWELADPVVSPAYTPGLSGRPNELKIKYLADNDYADLSPEEKACKIQDQIKRSEHQSDSDAAEGTTPRRLTDLLGSLADLSSGSGDKGTPFVYIQGYFDTYADDDQ